MHNLINANPEFAAIYTKYENQGLIFSFSIFDNIFDNVLCFPEDIYSMSIDKGPTLKKIYETNYNLLTPYVTMLYTLNALMGYNIKGDIIDDSTKVVIGKNYITKNFPNVYDCICPWIESNNFIFDPVLGIMVHKSIKEDMGYFDIKSGINWSVDFDKRSNVFNLFNITLCGDKKLNLYRRYVPPKTMLEMYDTIPTKSNNSTEIRDYIKTYKKDIYKTFNMLISMGKIVDLTCDMKKYDNCYFANNYNPDLSLGKLLRFGQNYGKCGIFAKAFSNMFYGDKYHTMHIGKCSAIIGSKNSYDGCHAWLEVDGMIVDTSLMAIIPIEFKETFGYVTENIQHLGTDSAKTLYFGDVIDISDELMYGDILYNNKINASYFYHYDFAEDLPHLINNNGMDKISRTCLLVERCAED